jgi:hypothetical protein
MTDDFVHVRADLPPMEGDAVAEENILNCEFLLRSLNVAATLFCRFAAALLSTSQVPGGLPLFLASTSRPHFILPTVKCSRVFLSSALAALLSKVISTVLSRVLFGVVCDSNQLVDYRMHSIARELGFNFHTRPLHHPTHSLSCFVHVSLRVHSSLDLVASVVRSAGIVQQAGQMFRFLPKLIINAVPSIHPHCLPACWPFSLPVVHRLLLSKLTSIQRPLKFKVLRLRRRR